MIWGFRIRILALIERRKELSLDNERGQHLKDDVLHQGYRIESLVDNSLWREWVWYLVSGHVLGGLSMLIKGLAPDSKRPASAARVRWCRAVREFFKLRLALTVQETVRQH